MPSPRAPWIALAVTLGLAAIAASGAYADTADTQEKCIRVRAEARYRGLGYNHIVHVADVCATPAECDVTTDVNPEPQHAVVPAHGEVEVTTFLGSPARVFVPRVTCTMGSH